MHFLVNGKLYIPQCSTVLTHVSAFKITGSQRVQSSVSISEHCQVEMWLLRTANGDQTTHLGSILIVVMFYFIHIS